MSAHLQWQQALCQSAHAMQTATELTEVWYPFAILRIRSGCPHTHKVCRKINKTVATEQTARTSNTTCNMFDVRGTLIQPLALRASVCSAASASAGSIKYTRLWRLLAICVCDADVDVASSRDSVSVSATVLLRLGLGLGLGLCVTVSATARGRDSRLATCDSRAARHLNTNNNHNNQRRPNGKSN